MKPKESDHFYYGREATQIKHLILRRYLTKLALKVGTFCNTFNYVEGFAGPWRSEDESLEDTSPHIALRELDKARDGLSSNRRNLRMRTLFVESDPESARRLSDSLARRAYSSVINGEFLNVLPDIQRFMTDTSLERPVFTFFFVDPTGWTGYDPEVIAPLLRGRGTEVIINFMTSHIVRFIDSSPDSIHRTFLPLFGNEAAWDTWRNLAGHEREDAIVRGFCSRLKEVGGFEHVVAAPILNPTRDRTSFHLVYGTRSLEGLRTFREAERGTIPDQAIIRERARHRKHEERSGQPSIFDVTDVDFTSYVFLRMEHYHDQARTALLERLETSGFLSFEDMEGIALMYPMTADQNLKDWLVQWKEQGIVRFEGLAPRGRVPQPNRGHGIQWVAPS